MDGIIHQVNSKPEPFIKSTKGCGTQNRTINYSVGQPHWVRDTGRTASEGVPYIGEERGKICTLKGAECVTYAEGREWRSFCQKTAGAEGAEAQAR
jgi:hypothetical protein